MTHRIERVLRPSSDAVLGVVSVPRMDASEGSNACVANVPYYSTPFLETVSSTMRPAAHRTLSSSVRFWQGKSLKWSSSCAKRRVRQPRVWCADSDGAWIWTHVRVADQLAVDRAASSRSSKPENKNVQKSQIESRLWGNRPWIHWWHPFSLFLNLTWDTAIFSTKTWIKLR